MIFAIADPLNAKRALNPLGPRRLEKIFPFRIGKGWYHVFAEMKRLSLRILGRVNGRECQAAAVSHLR
jgi:hypothetical protein